MLSTRCIGVGGSSSVRRLPAAARLKRNPTSAMSEAAAGCSNLKPSACSDQRDPKEVMTIRE